jgi:hypothetical protein
MEKTYNIDVTIHTLDLILEWSNYGNLIDLNFKVRKLSLHTDSCVST